MVSRSPRFARRSVALALAYMLALQGILTAWAVLAPAAAAVLGAQTVLCATHANSPAPGSDLPATQCVCGPLCHANAGPSLGAPPETASAVAAPPVAVAIVWQARRTEKTPETFTGPQQARAPPLTA